MSARMASIHCKRVTYPLTREMSWARLIRRSSLVQLAFPGLMWVKAFDGLTCRNKVGDTTSVILRKTTSVKVLQRVQAPQAIESRSNIANSVIGTKKGMQSVFIALITKGGAKVARSRNAAMVVTTGVMTTALAEGHRPDESRREVGAPTVTRGAGERRRRGPIRPIRG